MYQAAIGVLGSIGLTLLYFYILNIPKHWKVATGRILGKPFGCAFCMSFWISLSYLLWNTTILEAIFIGSTTPFIYLLVEDYITNKFEL
jgi:hypothetical protein